MAARFRWKTCALVAAAMMAGGFFACNGPSGGAPPTATDAIPLYAKVPDSAATLLVYRGHDVSIQWSTDVSTSGIQLVYRAADSEGETEIAASATGGTYSWTVPTTLNPDTVYEIVAYAVDTTSSITGTETTTIESATGADTTTNGDMAATTTTATTGAPLASSAPFTVADDPLDADADSNGSPDADSNGPGGTPCATNEECDDGLYCNGCELCVAQVCVAGAGPCGLTVYCDETTHECIEGGCATDADCPSGETCADGMCESADAGSNGLMGFAFDTTSNGVIDFSQPLTVGDTIAIVSPGVPSEGASLEFPALPAAEAGGCACAWSVAPATAGAFDPADACETEFTVAAAGAMQIAVAVSRGTATAAYRQDAFADPAPPPQACVDDAECPANESCIDGFCAVPPPPAPTIEVLEEVVRAPYVVRLNTRLTDKDGQVIPTGVTSAMFRVFENGVALDLTETNRFVTPAENLPLRVILVLDYSASMRAADATGAMVKAAVTFVRAEHFTATHRIGVVEFHDRGDEGAGFSAAVPLTVADIEGKQAIVDGIPTATELESGLTRVWDAVDLAATMLGENERKPGEMRAIVFLTDGRDTTSEADAEAVASAAAEGEIKLYAIGFGDVAEHETELRALAEDSGGSYFPAKQADELLDVFTRIALDLRGQWNLTYITQRNTGLVEARVEFDWENQTALYETSFDAGQLGGDIHEGAIEILNRNYNAYTDRTEFLLSAAYIPRGINRFRFVFAHGGAEFDLQGAGGLTDPAQGWSLTNLGSGAYLLLNSSPLEYGAFGNIGTVAVPGQVDRLQVTHDDALYSGLSQPKTIAFEGDLWAAPYTLTTSVSTEGAGVVVAAPQKSGYGHGEIVLVTAIPAEGKVFSKWTGDTTATTASFQLTMNGNKTVTATFADAPAEE
jgi:Mg-chelatase subunit ChlD